MKISVFRLVKSLIMPINRIVALNDQVQSCQPQVSDHYNPVHNSYGSLLTGTPA